MFFDFPIILQADLYTNWKILMSKDSRIKRETEIMEAAVKLFASKGYGSTKMADIASEAGLSVGNLYFYFKNKDELYITSALKASNIIYDAIIDGIKSVDKEANALDKIIGIFQGYQKVMQENSSYREVFTSYVSRVVCMSRSEQYQGITERMQESKDFEKLQEIQWKPAVKIITILQKGKMDKSITCQDSSMLMFTNLWAFMIGTDAIFFPELKEGIGALGIPPLNLEAWKASSLKMIISYLTS